MRLRLVLGSGSPRRAELLDQLGLVPDEIRVPDTDETALKGETPQAYCRRVAAGKAAAMRVADDEVVLCADTTVALGRRILGKPENIGEARAFLRALSGRRHRVITSIVVRNATRTWSRDIVTQVKVKRLSKTELEAYLATEDWRGKAGGYGIQGPAGALVPWIQGSYSAVMGLPLVETAQLLQAAGLTVWKDTT